MMALTGCRRSPTFLYAMVVSRSNQHVRGSSTEQNYWVFLKEDTHYLQAFSTRKLSLGYAVCDFNVSKGKHYRPLSSPLELPATISDRSSPRASLSP